MKNTIKTAKENNNNKKVIKSKKHISVIARIIEALETTLFSCPETCIETAIAY